MRNAPQALLEREVHVPAAPGKPERDHLADAHHHVPRRPPRCRRELLEDPLVPDETDLGEGLRLVVPEEDGEQHLSLLGGRGRRLATGGGVDEQEAEEGEGEKSSAHAEEGSGVPRGDRQISA
jgi:hypothetical protein